MKKLLLYTACFIFLMANQVQAGTFSLFIPKFSGVFFTRNGDRIPFDHFDGKSSLGGKLGQMKVTYDTQVFKEIIFLEEKCYCTLSTMYWDYGKVQAISQTGERLTLTDVLFDPNETIRFYFQDEVTKSLNIGEINIRDLERITIEKNEQNK